MAHCRWWECGCAEILPDHRGAVDHAIGEAHRHLRVQKLPASQRRVLRAQLAAMEAKRDALTQDRHGT